MSEMGSRFLRTCCGVRSLVFLMMMMLIMICEEQELDIVLVR